jgi:hypothetical protein
VLGRLFISAAKNNRNILELRSTIPWHIHARTFTALRRGLGFALRLVYLLPCSFEFASNACNGRRHRRSNLAAVRIACVSPWSWTNLTNKISSAVEANEALMKLKSKGATLCVDFVVIYASFSFEGYITDLDDSTLTIDAPQFQQRPASLTLSALQISIFDGDFREDEFGMFLNLMITRPIGPTSDELYCFHVVGEWSPEGVKGSHIN